MDIDLQNYYNEEINYKKKKVYYLLSTTNKKIGEYTGYYPKQAAQKAFTRILRKHLNNQIKERNGISQEYEFKIMDKETKKIYTYTGMRVRLENPKIVYYGNKRVVHRFKNVIAQNN